MHITAIQTFIVDGGFRPWTFVKAAPGGGMTLSFGGGVSPGTRPENIDALLAAAREWSASK